MIHRNIIFLLATKTLKKLLCPAHWDLRQLQRNYRRRFRHQGWLPHWWRHRPGWQLQGGRVRHKSRSTEERLSDLHVRKVFAIIDSMSAGLKSPRFVFNVWLWPLSRIRTKKFCSQNTHNKFLCSQTLPTFLLYYQEISSFLECISMVWAMRYKFELDLLSCIFIPVIIHTKNITECLSLK